MVLADAGQMRASGSSTGDGREGRADGERRLGVGAQHLLRVRGERARLAQGLEGPAQVLSRTAPARARAAPSRTAALRRAERRRRLRPRRTAPGWAAPGRGGERETSRGGHLKASDLPFLWSGGRSRAAASAVAPASGRPARAARGRAGSGARRTAASSCSRPSVARPCLASAACAARRLRRRAEGPTAASYRARTVPGRAAAASSAESPRRATSPREDLLGLRGRPLRRRARP